MALSTTSDIKTMLGITSTTYDTMITALLDAFESILAAELGLDTFASATYTNYSAEVCVDDCTGDYFFILPHYPISSVDKLYDYNGTEYTGFTASFETTAPNRRVTLDRETISPDDCIIVDYTAGFTALPDDLTLALSFMVAGHVFGPNRQGGVSEYSLGTKTVKFASQADQMTYSSIVKKYATKYKMINVHSV